MVPTFILTRTFAISALFVGAFPVTYAAPIPSAASPSVTARGCRQMGCLYALPSADNNTSTDASIPVTIQIPSGGFSQESMQVIDFLVSVLSAARSASTDASTTVVTAAVEEPDDTVKVGGFLPAALKESVDRLAKAAAAKVSSVAERAVSSRAEPTTPEEFKPDDSVGELAEIIRVKSSSLHQPRNGEATVATVADEVENLDALL